MQYSNTNYTQHTTAASQQATQTHTHNTNTHSNTTPHNLLLLCGGGGGGGGGVAVCGGVTVCPAGVTQQGADERL